MALTEDRKCTVCGTWVRDDGPGLFVLYEDEDRACGYTHRICLHREAVEKAAYWAWEAEHYAHKLLGDDVPADRRAMVLARVAQAWAALASAVSDDEHE